ncbi:MAG: PKD domain-containing protein [Methanosarcina sp.]
MYSRPLTLVLTLALVTFFYAQFTDLSENTAERYWNFGVGTNSTEQNPAHTYSAAGN